MTKCHNDRVKIVGFHQRDNFLASPIFYYPFFISRSHGQNQNLKKVTLSSKFSNFLPIVCHRYNAHSFSEGKMLLFVQFMASYVTIILSQNLAFSLSRSLTLLEFSQTYSYVHMKPLLGLFIKGNWHFSKWCNAV